MTIDPEPGALGFATTDDRIAHGRGALVVPITGTKVSPGDRETGMEDRGGRLCAEVTEGP